MSRRLCIRCGITQPLDTFSHSFPSGYARVCKLHKNEIIAEEKALKKTKKGPKPKSKKRPMKANAQQEAYMRSRNKGPRRVTQMKANRLPVGYPPTMSKNDYAIYLTSPHWVKFRDWVKGNLPWLCFVCDQEADDLHHHNYARLGSESVEDVIPLCRKHHKDVHKFVRKGVALGNAHVYTRERYRRGELDIKVTRVDN